MRKTFLGEWEERRFQSSDFYANLGYFWCVIYSNSMQQTTTVNCLFIHMRETQLSFLFSHMSIFEIAKKMFQKLKMMKGKICRYKSVYNHSIIPLLMHSKILHVQVVF